MRLLVEVDGKREHLGRLITFLDSGARLSPVEVCLTADESSARAAGNPGCDPLRPGGHAPFGTYRLREVRDVPDASRDEYGSHSLVFEPQSGEALQAESFGRLALALHGGELGEDGRLRTTDGGFRVGEDTLRLLVSRMKPGDTLEVREAPLGFWERLLGRRRRPSGALRERETQEPDRWEPDRSYGDRAPGGRAGDPAERFEPGGGAFGGAGASGAWDAPPRTDVTAAGAAAAGAAGGLLAAGLLASDAPGGTEPPGPSTDASHTEASTTY